MNNLTQSPRQRSIEIVDHMLPDFHFLKKTRSGKNKRKEGFRKYYVTVLQKFTRRFLFMVSNHVLYSCEGTDGHTNGNKTF